MLLQTEFHSIVLTILNVKVVSKYKSSSCLITVRFLRSPIYSGRPSCLPIYLQGRRKVHKFSRISTDCLFMFLFLNWDLKWEEGRSQEGPQGTKGAQKCQGVTRDPPVPPALIWCNLRLSSFLYLGFWKLYTSLRRSLQILYAPGKVYPKYSKH